MVTTSTEYVLTAPDSVAINAINKLMRTDTELGEMLRQSSSHFYSELYSRIKAIPELQSTLFNVSFQLEDSFSIKLRSNTELMKYSKKIEAVMSSFFNNAIEIEELSIDLKSDVRMVSAKILGKEKGIVDTINNMDISAKIPGFISISMKNQVVTAEFLPYIVFRTSNGDGRDALDKFITEVMM